MTLKHVRHGPHTECIQFSPPLPVFPPGRLSACLPMCSCVLAIGNRRILPCCRCEPWNREGEAALNMAMGPVYVACPAMNVCPLSQDMTPFCKRPLQHLFLFIVPLLSSKTEAHKSLIYQWSHSERNGGKGNTRNHKLFATKLAFSHTQLISGRLRASLWPRSCSVFRFLHCTHLLLQ